MQYLFTLIYRKSISRIFNSITAMSSCGNKTYIKIIFFDLAKAFLFLASCVTSAAQAPSLTAAFSNAPHWITISYQHPGDGGVKQFLLEQKGVSTIVNASANLSDNFTITGLEPGTLYQFRVCASYDNRDYRDYCSQWVDVTTMTSQANLPPQVAPEVRYVKASSNTVTIGWGNVGDYRKLLVRVEDDRGNSDQRDVRPTAFAEFTFPGMRSNARYKLLIKGCGDQNYTSCGPWSKGHWVTTPTKNQCIQGYVWREAYIGDLVCVEPWVRDQARIDNAAAPTRVAPCRSGYVPRGAVKGDKVCVTPVARDLSISENAMNLKRSTHVECARRSPDPSACPNPAPCKRGFVHRQATPEDYVCALPKARTRVHQENISHPQNKGTNTCIDGYVWRITIPSDLVCVKPDIRNQAVIDNAVAASRVAE